MVRAQTPLRPCNPLTRLSIFDTIHIAIIIRGQCFIGNCPRFFELLNFKPDIAWKAEFVGVVEHNAGGVV